MIAANKPVATPIPYSIIVRGTTNTAGNFEQLVILPPGCEGRCSVSLASLYLSGTASYEIRLGMGTSGQTYDTLTGGPSDTLLVNCDYAPVPPT
eukprot:45681-Eustigmatos_ZCMA.PRE.1